MQGWSNNRTPGPKTSVEKCRTNPLTLKDWATAPLTLDEERTTALSFYEDGGRAKAVTSQSAAHGY